MCRPPTSRHVSLIGMGALLCGVLSFPAVFLYLGYGASLSLVALLFGCLSIWRSKQRPMDYSGRWVPMVGIILGLASLLLLQRMLASQTMYGRL
jgi:hypothetical protein